ncbi:acyltransferase family protein [Pedobacter sp. AW1-32]|uniref:acyltransferase family protein n=1 Tax=Pedobacter sp. AW1-32 TaxID=3383026 RepID=UPI003FEFF026
MTEQVNKKLIVCEAIRGILALLVICGHLVSRVESIRMKQNHILNFFTVWGRECVFLFFILSGVVIHYSFTRHNRPKSRNKDKV